MRKEFEKLPEIAAELENSDGELYWCDKQNQYRNNRVFQDSQTGWMNGAWYAWQAKAQAVPEGFVLVETSKINTWYQDDDEPENLCNSESDLDFLGDCLDDDDIIIVNVHESAHISTRKVFGVWKSNSPTDIQSKFILVDSRVEAEQVVAENKTMIEAQEQNQ